MLRGTAERAQRGLGCYQACRALPEVTPFGLSILHTGHSVWRCLARIGTNRTGHGKVPGRGGAEGRPVTLSINVCWRLAPC